MIMKYAFQKMRLEAQSLYALIQTWAEMHLTLTEDSATITGYGYTYDIAGAFSDLVLDWEATILLPRDRLDFALGEFDLLTVGEELYAFRNQQQYPVPDGPVILEVVSMPEE